MKSEFVEYNKFARQGNGDPYPRLVVINDLRDSFIINKELNKEACHRFMAMKHNIFENKSSLEMVALENYVLSPW